ncbi:MAG: hypothetical protein CMH63_01490 [Nanoarchaeota archaeon]|nr:hypothetical protein [Nanoarchaeota archaeon]
MVIRQIGFDHKGGWYHYRIHTLKTSELCKDRLFELRQFLEEMFKDCPHHYFQRGPRSSTLKFKLDNLDLKHVKNHDLCDWTSHGLEQNRSIYKTAHSKVQVFMLENDDKTIAVEIPLWLKPEEVEFYQSLFKTNEPLTGHIDLLRIEGNKIWVLDYKPKARLEKFAATQIYFYALMLSKRIKIPLEKFRCGYFDDQDCYLFRPDECSIPKMKNISDFC